MDLLGREAGQRVGRGRLFSWVPVAGLQVDFGLHLDPLSVCFVLLITGVGFLIHLYSVGYMAHDPGGDGFRVPEPVRGGHAAAGAGRQLRGSLRGLGGVGLASYLLIGFWSGK